MFELKSPSWGQLTTEDRNSCGPLSPVPRQQPILILACLTSLLVVQWTSPKQATQLDPWPYLLCIMFAIGAYASFILLHKCELLPDARHFISHRRSDVRDVSKYVVFLHFARRWWWKSLLYWPDALFLTMTCLLDALLSSEYNLKLSFAWYFLLLSFLFLFNPNPNPGVRFIRLPTVIELSDVAFVPSVYSFLRPNIHPFFRVHWP